MKVRHANLQVGDRVRDLSIIDEPSGTVTDVTNPSRFVMRTDTGADDHPLFPDDEIEILARGHSGAVLVASLSPIENVLTPASAPATEDQSQKKDAGKPPWDLLPFDAVEQVVKVLQFGAAKYAARGWERDPMRRGRAFAAVCRHMVDWWRGQRNDEETGLPVLAHAACEVLFLLAYELRGAGGEIDLGPDAPKGGAK